MDKQNKYLNERINHLLKFGSPLRCEMDFLGVLKKKKQKNKNSPKKERKKIRRRRRGRAKMGATQTKETKHLLQVEGDYENFKMVPFYARFATVPFAEGSMRWCYEGRILNDKGKIVHPDAFPEGKCVVKAFKEGSATNAQGLTDDYKNSYFADRVAVMFNQKIPTTRPLRFAIPFIAQLDAQTGPKASEKVASSNVKEKLASREWVSIEPFISGEYRKFTSNSGWVDPHIGNAIPAYMHFSWLYSRGTIVVSDIQGVRCNTCYMLTDPATQSINREFGETDLGAEGIVRFLTTHVHTDLCRNMPWPNKSDIDVFKSLLTMKPVMGTTFSFQLPSEVSNNPGLKTGYSLFISKFFRDASEGRKKEEGEEGRK